MVVSDKLPPTGDERCGTRAGYQAHRRRVEVPCDSCRQSQSDHDRAHYEANREAMAAQSRAYYAANREARTEYGHAYREANREAIAERHRVYYEANRESRADYNRAYREANREALTEQKRAYYAANREALTEQGRAYYAANREASADHNRAYREANREGIYLKKVLRSTVLAQAFEDVAVHKYQAWTVEDEAIIRATYDQPVVMVAAQLRRTPFAVIDRRVALRKLDRNQRKVTS